MDNSILLPLQPGTIGRTIFHQGAKASIKAYPYMAVSLEESEDCEAPSYELYTLNEGKERTLKTQVLIKIIGPVLVKWGECELPSIMFRTRRSNNLIFSPNNVHTLAGLRPPKVDSTKLFE